MPQSFGPGLPTVNIQEGHRNVRSGEGFIRRYLGGDPADELNNWLVDGGRSSNDPDTTGWNQQQAGAMWYNRNLGFLRLWNGVTVLSIPDISAGVTDHGALTGLGDDDHPQYHDGSLAYTGDLNMGGNDIVVVGLVDGIDVSALAAAFVAHAADATIHFTEASIDHTAIQNIGTNSHVAIDTHIADGTIHFTEGSIDHGSIAGLADDDHLQYLLLAGRAGGQTANGGTVAGDILELQGSSSSPDVGIIQTNSPIHHTYDTFSNTTPAQQFLNVWDPTVAINAAYIGGYLQVAPVMTITIGTFIPATFSDTSNILGAAAPGFSAFTFINELALVENLGNFNLLSALVINIGLTHERNTSGTSTTPGTTGMNFSPQTRATVSGAVITKTTQTAIRLAPTFSTVSGSTANLGTIAGLQCNNPTFGLFQPSAGVETMLNYWGVNVAAIAFGGNVQKAAVRSVIAAASNAYFLLNLGTAQSNFNGAHLFDVGIVQHLGDGILFSNSYGAAGGDLISYWDGTGFVWNPLVGSTLRLRQLVGEQIFEIDAGAPVETISFNFAKFNFGQTGTGSNQVGVFVAGARTTEINGGWADFLLTQAGNLTIDDTMSEVNAWVINAISLTSGTGSITGFVSTLTIGGMTTSGLGGAETHAVRHTGRRTARGVDAFELLSPAAFTVDVDDYEPATGNSMRQVWRVTTDDLGGITISGIVIQQTSDTQWIVNVGTVDSITLGHQDAGSAAANRIISPTGANYVLGPSEAALLWYDDTTARWRIMWGTGA